MPWFWSNTGGDRASGALARGLWYRRLRAGIASLAVALMANGCVSIPPASDAIVAEDAGGKLAQAMRMADSVKARGDMPAAAFFYRRAHNLAPDRPEPLLGLAQAAAATGANEEAAQAYRQVVAIAPNNTEARLGFGRVLLALDRPELATDELRKAIDADPNDHRAYLALGVAFDLACDPQQAQQVYRAGLQHSPGNLSLRNNLGLSLALAGDGEEGITMLSELARELGSGARVRQNLALAYALSGRTDEAAALAQRELKGPQLQHNLALYQSLRGLTAAGAANVLCNSAVFDPVSGVARRAVATPTQLPARGYDTADATRGAIVPAKVVGGGVDGPTIAPSFRSGASAWMPASAARRSPLNLDRGSREKPAAAQVQPSLDNTDGKAGAPASAEAASYTVKSGDTLSLIAKRYYGSARKYTALLEANSSTFSHPDRIYPGMVVHIPVLS